MQSASRRRGSSHFHPAVRFLLAAAVGVAAPLHGAPQLPLGERVSVVDMIPQSLSGETGQDSEPNIAVDPSTPTHILGSAFTLNPTGATTSAPVFVSTDRGATWAMNNIVPSGNGMTGDISLAFAQSGGRAYIGILRGGSSFRLQFLRTTNPFGPGLATVFVDRNNIDQPWTEAKTTPAGGATVDRVYAGNNDFGGPGGRTASIESSLDAGAGAPAFMTSRLETRATQGQDMPPIRVSIHNDGTAYGIFYRWASANVPSARCDVVVVRDDNWAAGPTRFADLTDPGDSQAGLRVATNRLVPAFPASLGANRLVASNLSIAVAPNASGTVWIAWADRTGTTDYTLHVRRSTDRGATWSDDLLTVTNATNPALSVNSAGVAGFLFQQLTGTAPNQTWETHFRRSATGTSWSDLVLARTPDNNPAPTFQPYIGDYTDVVSVDQEFYGIFSASNIPDRANFPAGVTYQRNANFTTHQLLDVDNTTAVNPSIDPFFFSVRSSLVVVDICTLNPRLCVNPAFARNQIRFRCDILPCRVVDPLPKNCTVKWECPGCSPDGLCPPWYHIFLEGLDPRVITVGLFTRKGDEVEHVVQQVSKGVVVSFRPSERLFKKGSIGDYVLTFEAEKVEKGKEFRFRTLLDVSDGPKSQKFEN